VHRSLGGEHAFSDKAVAEAVECEDNVILVSLEKLHVEVEVIVAHLEHVVEGLHNPAVLDKLDLFKVGDLIEFL